MYIPKLMGCSLYACVPIQCKRELYEESVSVAYSDAVSMARYIPVLVYITQASDTYIYPSEVTVERRIVHNRNLHFYEYGSVARARRLESRGRLTLWCYVV